MEKYKKEEVIHQKNIPARIILQGYRAGEGDTAPHWHQHLELNLVLCGAVDFFVSGKEKRVQEGEMILVNSGEIHAGKSAVDKDYVELVTVLWDYDFFENYCSGFSGYLLRLSEDAGINKEIRDMLIEIAVLEHDKNPFYEMKISERLLHVGYLLLRYCLVERDREFTMGMERKVEQMQEAILYLEEHFREDIHLKDIARHMNMSPYYFSRKFKEYTGINFYDCLTQCRLLHAREELRSATGNITDIAYNNGFPNVKSFIVQFREKYHVTPKQYQKSYSDQIRNK